MSSETAFRDANGFTRASTDRVEAAVDSMGETAQALRLGYLADLRAARAARQAACQHAPAPPAGPAERRERARTARLTIRSIVGRPDVCGRCGARLTRPRIQGVDAGIRQRAARMAADAVLAMRSRGTWRGPAPREWSRDARRWFDDPILPG